MIGFLLPLTPYQGYYGTIKIYITKVNQINYKLKLKPMKYKTKLYIIHDEFTNVQLNQRVFHLNLIKTNKR